MALSKIKSDSIDTVAAAKLTGTVDNARIVLDAAEVPNIDASKITTGNIAAARVPADAVTQHRRPAELGFSNVSTWADSAVKTVTLSTAATAIGKTQVSVFEEVPNSNKTNASWDISTNDTGFNLIDSAYTQTLTPAATTGSSIAFTLGSGSWVAADIGKRIVNVSSSEAGVARIISIVGAVATCVITTTFTDTNAIASGDWELYSAEFTGGKFTLSNAIVSGGSNISFGTTVAPPTENMAGVGVTKLTSTTALAFFDGPGYNVSARVLTITGNAVSLGTPITVQAFGGDPGSIDVTTLTSTLCIATWRGASGYPKAVALTVSGTTVTAGSILNVENTNAYYCRTSALSSTQAIMVNNNSYQYGRAVVLTVSGTTVSAGAIITTDTYASLYMDVAALTSTKAIVVFRDGGNSLRGTARVLTISGTSVSAGASTTFNTLNASHINIAKLSSTKAIVVWQEADSAPTPGKTCVLTQSGTTVTAGTPVTHDTAATLDTSIAYISDDKVLVTYKDTTNTRGVALVVEVSGTVPSPKTKFEFRDGDIGSQSCAALTDNKLILIEGEGGHTVLDLETATYLTNQYVTTISGTDSVDTTYYSDWNSNTATETLNSQSAYYAFSVNSTPSAAEVTGGTFMIVGGSQTATRNIVSSLSSVHGGAAGVWHKNTNTTYGSATWAAATTNEAKAAIQEATAITANQMSGTAFAAISDTNLPALGTQLSVAMTLYSSDSTKTPTIDGVSFNYDGNVINRLKTDDYTVEMPSTGVIKVTAPSSGGPRNARIYVSS